MQVSSDNDNNIKNNDEKEEKTQNIKNKKSRKSMEIELNDDNIDKLSNLFIECQKENNTNNTRIKIGGSILFKPQKKHSNDDIIIGWISNIDYGSNNNNNLSFKDKQKLKNSQITLTITWKDTNNNNKKKKLTEKVKLNSKRIAFLGKSQMLKIGKQ